jgi:hypothetical protein
MHSFFTDLLAKPVPEIILANILSKINQFYEDISSMPHNSDLKGQLLLDEKSELFNNGRRLTVQDVEESLNSREFVENHLYNMLENNNNITELDDKIAAFNTPVLGRALFFFIKYLEINHNVPKENIKQYLRQLRTLNLSLSDVLFYYLLYYKHIMPSLEITQFLSDKLKNESGEKMINAVSKHQPFINKLQHNITGIIVMLHATTTRINNENLHNYHGIFSINTVNLIKAILATSTKIQAVDFMICNGILRHLWQLTDSNLHNRQDIVDHCQSQINLLDKKNRTIKNKLQIFCQAVNHQVTAQAINRQSNNGKVNFFELFNFQGNKASELLTNHQNFQDDTTSELLTNHQLSDIR